MENEHKYHAAGAVNPDYNVKKSGVRDLEYYIRGLTSGNKYVLSEAITLIESQRESKHLVAGLLLDWAFTHVAHPTIRIAVTGTPGVGKSTFIEAFGKMVKAKGHKLAILTIDPSSQVSKGSILGDKTRMAGLSQLPEVFIRPSASGNMLGGTAAQTKDAILLCEAAGFDIIIVETVGVGQSETEVNNMTDVSLLLLQPGAGDEMQGIKRGIMENADIIIINKADGPQADLATETQKDYSNAVQLFHHPMPDWRQPVLKVSSVTGSGLEEVWVTLMQYITLSKAHDVFNQKRKHQEGLWFKTQVMAKLEQIIFNNSMIRESYQKLLRDISNEAISTSAAINKMIRLISAELQNE